VGVGGLFGYHALYFAALRLAPPAEASLIAFLWPLLIVLMSALLPGERLSARHIVGALLGFGGAAVLFWGKIGAGAANLTHTVALGYLLALGCAFVWSSYSVLSRRLRQAPTEAVAGFCLVTSALAAICHVAFETTAIPENFSQAAAIVGLGLGPVGLAFYVWDYGVKNGDIRLLGVAALAPRPAATRRTGSGARMWRTPQIRSGVPCPPTVGGYRRVWPAACCLDR
jgi:drug/metabolite transporter (DMT)-like permease